MWWSQNQSWRTMMGVILIKIATGVISCWGSINIYILSYFYHHGASISSSTNSIILLMNVIPIAFLILFAPTLCERFGYENVVRVCGLIFFLSPLAIYYKVSAFVVGFFCVLMPVSAYSVSSIPVINCLWTQFPKDKNKATSAAVISFGVGGAIWNYLFTLYVNPHNQTTSVADPNTNMLFFSQEVSSRVVRCLKIGYLLCGTLFLVGAQLVKKNHDYEDTTINRDTEIQLLGPSYVPLQQEQNKKQQKQTKNRPQSLKAALKDPRFVSIFFISFLTGIYQIFLNMNLKIIYMPIVHDDRFLVFCAISATAASIVGAFVWGYIADKQSFYLLLLIFTGLDFLIKIYGSFALTKAGIMVLFILIGFVDKAMLTVMGPGLVKIFGIQIATELLPYKGFSVFLGFLVAPIGYLLLSSILSPFQYLQITTIFSLASIFLAVRLYKKY